MARRQTEFPAFAGMSRWVWMAVALVVMALPARADSPASGTFTAATACPAVSSIKKGTNPGNVRLTPQQGYQVVSANNTPATHYLVLVPGADPDRRWVELGCGTLSTSTSANPSSTTAAPTPTPPLGPPNRAPAGTPTHYVLALSWEPAFCTGHDGKPECAAETPSSFEASHFTLHGLWPDPREYCGASAADIAADKAGHWDQLPAVELSGTTRARLAQAMPGTQSLLERHEWLRHGTCSGVDAESYFGRAVALLDAINTSPLQQLFADQRGQTVTLRQIRDAFARKFGAGTGDRLRLACTGDRGDRLVSELTIGLEGDVMAATDLATLVAAARPTNGGCTAGVVLQVQ